MNLPLSLWQQHVESWSGCELCELCQRRQNVVLGRGQLPCDILIIGEAPGPSEDCTGIPFAPGAPAGNLMDQIIERSIPAGVTYSLTNIVACIPLEDDTNKFSEPPHESVLACQPRLKEFYDLAQPRLVIAAGKTAHDYLDQSYKHSLKVKMPIVNIPHPAGLLRMMMAQRSYEVQRTIVVIRNAIEEHLSQDAKPFVPAQVSAKPTRPAFTDDDIPF